MANAKARDPNILEIVEICESVSTAFEYAKNRGLAVDVGAVGAQNTVPCSYTQGCTGTLYHTIVCGLPKIRCNRCKKYRSAMNGPAAFGVPQTSQTRDVVLGTCTCTRVQLEYRFQVLVLVLVLEG